MLAGALQLLVRLHEDVIPHLANPLLLADQLSGALDQGGLVGLLALHAIFVLVSKHGLEYPAFYTRLYQLLQPSTLLVSPCKPRLEMSTGLVSAWIRATRFSRQKCAVFGLGIV